MGHPIKHPIDPETGLCDICDGDAIREIKLGRRPTRRIIYVTQEERVAERSGDDEEVVYVQEEPSTYVLQEELEPQYVRKAVYQEPVVRSRRVVYEPPVEEPMVIRRSRVREQRLPTEEVVVRRRPAEAKTLYYVEHAGKRVPRVTSPPPTTSRRVIVHHSPPPTIKPVVATRKVRVVHRRSATPPPTIIRTIKASPRRDISSDTAVIGRRRRVRRTEVEAMNPPSEIIYDDAATSSRVDYGMKERRKETKHEPIESVPPPPAAVPTVVKRSYTRLPPGVDVPPDGDYAMNDKDKPALKDTSIYYIRSPSRAILEGA